MFKLLFFLGSSLLLFQISIAQQQATPAQAAEQRAKSFVEAFNSNNRAAWQKFIGDNYTKEALERVAPVARLNMLAKLYDESRGLTLKNVRRTKPDEIAASVVADLTGQYYDLFFQIEESAPYKIARFGSNLVAAPPESLKKITEQQIAPELDQYLKTITAANNFSGAVLFAKNDKILFEKAYGEANKDFHAANNTNTKFNLGSMNKMFTAVAIGQLVEAGKISFDDPLSKFLPDFPSKEAADRIKIKHLLSHTSGLGSYFTEKFITSSPMIYRTIDDYLELVKGDKPAFEPGTRWSYSNTGFLILGRVVEKASGQNYFDYIREHIYKPAGMTNTDSYELDLVNPNLAVGYTKDFTNGEIVMRNNTLLQVLSGGPAGGGYSTVEDLLKFASALQSGKLLKPETLQLMQSPKSELASPAYGYGFNVNVNRGTIGHGGEFMGVSANLDIYPQTGYTAVILSNYEGTRQPIMTKIYDLIRSRH